MSGHPSQFNLLDYFLGEATLSKVGNLPAIKFRDKQITYGQLRAEVDRWAQKLVNCDVSEGDRVALLLYDSPEFTACLLAIVSLGAIAVPINTFLPEHDVAFILSDSGARLLVVESDVQDHLRLILEPENPCTILKLDTQARSVHVDEADSGSSISAAHANTGSVAATRETPAFLLYTSGSTGTPKGVLHLHRSMPFTVDSYANSVLRLTSEDRVFSSSRMFFAYGLGNSLTFPLAAGATVLLEPERMNAERLATFMREEKPTVFFGVPAVYLSLLDYRSRGGSVDFSSVRLCVSAGEALPSKIFENWQNEFGLTILDGIGSTEMLHIFISNREGNSRAGSSGIVVDGYDARLVNDAGEDVEADELGNLCVRGGSATAGYWNRSELTDSTIVDGWVRTGDIYRRDADGFFYHIGRSDDCFKVHGLWVSPVEVESVLVSHEAVSEAAVVCAIDTSGLATAWAYVVIRQGERRDVSGKALEDELREFACSRLPQYKVPAQIRFIDEMPRTSTGKIQRYKLRVGSEHTTGGMDDKEK
ncbi:MAG TPA: benzoate-CoA ligase family protein [Blastocatellia bacterium]|nr:benzoate-CoA ligase family protein [Blastocatellia bacterium]